MITVIIPTLNEAENIAYAVRFAMTQPKVSEVIVVDDGSIDSTPEIASREGAIVVTSSLLGKGASIQDGIRIASNEFIVCIDGDMVDLADDLIHKLTSPLFEGLTCFCKAKFQRSGGRVTTLTAIPLLNIFFPELGSISQPLGGIFAAKRSLLDRLVLETDYGVDLGLLIDVQMAGERIVEIDVGTIVHESQPLSALANMASQVTRTILARAERYGRLNRDFLQSYEVKHRRQDAELPSLATRLVGAEGIALIDMDGTLLRGRFIHQLAKHSGRSNSLCKILDNNALDATRRTQLIAQTLAGIPQEDFIAVARKMELNRGVINAVRRLRQMKYAVGIITDSYQVVAETIRRRVFADFCVAHVLEFKNLLATGNIDLCPLMFSPVGCTVHPFCKKNVLLGLCEALGFSQQQVIAIGDSDNDICMLESAGTSIAFQPKSLATRQAAQATIHGCFSQIFQYVRPDSTYIASKLLCPKGLQLERRAC